MNRRLLSLTGALAAVIGATPHVHNGGVGLRRKQPRPAPLPNIDKQAAAEMKRERKRVIRAANHERTLVGQVRAASRLRDEVDRQRRYHEWRDRRDRALAEWRRDVKRGRAR